MRGGGRTPDRVGRGGEVEVLGSSVVAKEADVNVGGADVAEDAELADGLAALVAALDVSGAVDAAEDAPEVVAAEDGAAEEADADEAEAVLAVSEVTAGLLPIA